MSEEQQQQPMLTMNVTPQGVLISQQITAISVINTFLNEEQMNAICAEWLKTRRQVQKALELVKR